MDKVYDVIIVGGGPAGLSAGLYSSRANLSTLIIDKLSVGGQLWNTEAIDNYIGGFSTNSFELAMKMEEDAKSYGAEIINGEVVNITKLDNGLFKLDKYSGRVYYAKVVILATGTENNKLLPEKEENVTNGISYCAICDAPFYNGGDVAVVGAGDSAVEAVQLLSDVCHHVYMIVRKDHLRTDKYSLQSLIDMKNVTIMFQSNITEFYTDENGKLTSIDVVTNSFDKNETVNLQVMGLFPNIGGKPRLEMLSQLDVETHNNFIKVNDKLETNIKGLYAIGDVVSPVYRQVAIAVGHGALASLHAYDYIKTSK